jgi:hypothetical protein
MINVILKKINSRLAEKQKEKAKKYYWKFLSLKSKIKSKIKWFPRNLFVFLIWPFIKNKKIKNINLFEQKFYSQNGGDGIVQAIFHKIGTTNKFCVEFGIGNGTECYSRYLMNKKNWKCLQMDCGENLPLGAKREWITAENINFLFKKYDVPEEFDLLSIDIEFNDFWIWKAINGYFPRVVIVEYNASISPNKSRTVDYDPNAHWDGTDYFGASLLAMSNLGKEKGYTLIGCCNAGVNAFFVRSDLTGNNFETKSVAENYRPPRYGKSGNGHPKSNKIMTPV